jgi:A/G-specific adenine glycosylase
VEPAALAPELEAWYAGHARDLPWRRTRDPWAILLSEVLLQQTRAEAGARAFPALLARFPTPRAMARASDEEVLRAWAGLGYYRRARSLQAAARAIVARHGGEVPSRPDDLAALRGVGPCTAAAVRAFAFDEPAAPLDANVLRVLARLTGEARPVEAPATRKALERATLRIVARGSPRVLAQALMELGALVCTARSPRCHACPLARACAARAQGLQGQLPRRRAKARPGQEQWAFAHVRRGDALLLERRGPGMLEGFWALPGARVARGEAASAALQRHMARLGVRATVGEARARDRWAFTHRVWRFTVHPARLRSAGPLAPHARWVPLSELDALPLARPHRAHLGTADPRAAPRPRETL